MRYFVIIFIVIINLLLSACRKDIKDIQKDHIIKATNIEELAAYISELKPYIDNMSNKMILEDGSNNITYLEYLNPINKISDKAMDCIEEINELKKYNIKEFEVIRLHAKLEFLAMVNMNSKKDDKLIAETYINTIKLYTEILNNLYSSNININDYFKEYKEAFCIGEDCHHESIIVFYENIKEYLSKFNLEKENNKILHNILNYGYSSFTFYLFNTDYSIRLAPWFILFTKDYKFNQYQKEFEKNLLKYKISKSLKNAYLSKIYLQLFITDKDYSEQIILNTGENANESSYPSELTFERSSLLMSACTNPQYLLKGTLNECLSLIKNAESKEDLFSILEDENIASYVMINDILCAKKEESGYNFYNNSNIICKTLKEKINI